MLSNANFLCEIGTEEIPAGYLPQAMEQLARLFGDQLKEKRIGVEGIDVKATPRRLVVCASNMADSQREETVELKGPAVQAAYDAQGNPTKALEGFMKGNGLALDDLEKRSTPKGDYVFAAKTLPSVKTETIIPEIMHQIVMTLGFPKKMKWAGRTLEFPRPIRYFTILFNDRPVNFGIEGIESGITTRGHYIQKDGYFPVTSIASYEKLLESKDVILDQETRKKIIREELERAAGEAGGTLLEDEELIATVAYLVEKPHVVTCTFRESYLEIPDIVLIAEMREHQKYFAVLDKSGKLTRNFLVISNNPATNFVRSGNERVITARFNDAEFFYNEDRRVTLESRVETLKNVLFHKELGSVYDKIERLRKISRAIAARLNCSAEDSRRIERAVFLSKSDLDTALVYEFPSLQGKIGHVYALKDGEDPEVAAAIENHYRPRFAGDELPAGIVSQVVSLAEKIDNIAGSFSVGNIPKGSQDPYALRRQAGAVVDMLVGGELSISIEELLREVAGLYRDGEALIPQILDFFRARAKTGFGEAGFTHDEIDACLAVGSTDFCELDRRARAIHEFRKNDAFGALLSGFKRMNNILSAFRKEQAGYGLKLDPKVLEHEAELALFDFFEKRKDSMNEMIKGSRYAELFTVMTEGRTVIDGFFNDVMVMDNRIAVRDNRLALLESILAIFNGLMDFSRISDK